MANEDAIDFNMQPVVSSRVAELGHNGTTLRAVFPNGRSARYQGVSQETYAALMNAPSIGSAFGAVIVNGGFPFEYES